MTTRSQVGPMLREWRHRRKRSQLDLSLDVGVSAKHLSFVETGRSRPSPELVLALAAHLHVPLREQNRLLLAAGYAPRFSHTPLDDLALARVRQSLQRMLDAHDPYPGVLIDRRWNVVGTNRTASDLMAVVGDKALGPGPNVFRMCLHPDGLARATENFADWSAYLLRQLRRTIEDTGDDELAELEAELLALPGVTPPEHRVPVTSTEENDPELLVPFVVRLGGQRLSLFTTLTSFGIPRDVTLDELAVELFFPADDATTRTLELNRGMTGDAESA